MRKKERRAKVSKIVINDRRTKADRRRLYHANIWHRVVKPGYVARLMKEVSA